MCTVNASRVIFCHLWFELRIAQFLWIKAGQLLYTSLRRHLRSATRHHLTVPRYRLSTFGRRAFSVAGPTVWNSLPDNSLKVTVHRCLQNKALEYLVDCSTPVSDIRSRRHLRSATLYHLTVPRYRLSTFGCRDFSVAGPTVWNSQQQL